MDLPNKRRNLRPLFDVRRNQAIWDVFDIHWSVRNGDILQPTSLIQTDLLKSAQEGEEIATAGNISKNLADRSAHPRKKYLVEIDGELPDSDRAARLAHNAKPYFARKAIMGAGPMILQ